MRWSVILFAVLGVCLFASDAEAGCFRGRIAARLKARTCTAVERVRNVVGTVRPAPEVRLLPTVRRVFCDGVTCRSE